MRLHTTRNHDMHTYIAVIARWCLHPFRISEGSLIFMGAFLSSALLGVVRQVLFNAHFGIRPEADAYYAAFRLPETLATLLAGGTLANAMVPVLLHVARIEGEQAVQRFLNVVLTTLLAVALPGIILCIILARPFVQHILAPGFAPATREVTIVLTRIMMLELALAVVVGVATAYLTSRNQFLLPALSIALHNATLIMGIVATMLYPRLGIYGPTIGAVSDSVIQLCVLLPGLLMQGIRYTPRWDPNDAHVRLVLRLLLPNGLSGIANYAGTIIDTAFASLARATGSVSIIYNGWLLSHLPVRLLGVAIGQAAFPRLSAHAVAQEWVQMRRLLVQLVGIALALSCIAIGGLLLFGRSLIALLFERGAFDTAAGELTYIVVAVYACGMPAAIGTELLTRSLIALYDTRTPLITNCFQLAGRVMFIRWLLPIADIVAIPVAFVATSTLEMVALSAILFVKIHRKIHR